MPTTKEHPNVTGQLGTAYLGEGEEYVRVRLVARPVVRALEVVVPSLAGPQHEEVAQQPKVHRCRPERVPHIHALGCAPLQQPELQPNRRGGDYCRRDDENAERDE